MDQSNQEEKKEESAVRTFKGDVSSYLQSKKISWQELVSQKKEKGIGGFSAKQRKLVFILVGFVVILILALGGFFAYRKFATQTKTTKEFFRPPKTLVENQELIEIKNANRNVFFSALKQLQERPMGSKNFRAVYLTDKERNILGPKEFFALLEIKPPLSLSDTFEKEITLGLIGKNQNQGGEFIILIPVKNFERAFSAMLKWESALAMNFRFFINEEKLKDLRPDLFFRDLTIKNQSARFLENEKGEELAGYAIFNRKILVIGFSKEALEIVIEKLLASPPNI